jgi:hypothetical protein
MQLCPFPYLAACLVIPPVFLPPLPVFESSGSEVTPELVDDLLSDLQPRFRPQDYNLLFHNCNTFSNELVQLLTGESLPVGAFV